LAFRLHISQGVPRAGTDEGICAAGAGEHSSQPSLPGLEEHDQHHLPGHAEQPANSLLSTAMRPSSPPMHRAHSLVSYTAAHSLEARELSAARAGTPASVYGQGRVPLPCPRPQSPQGSVAGAGQQVGSASVSSDAAKRGPRSSNNVNLLKRASWRKNCQCLGR
jgi:hypothetical protein